MTAAVGTAPGNVWVNNVIDPVVDNMSNLGQRLKQWGSDGKQLLDKNSPARVYLGDKFAPYSSKARAAMGVTKTIGKEGGRVTWSCTKSVTKWSKDVLVAKWDNLGLAGKCTRGLTVAGGIWSTLDGCKAALLAREVWMGAGARTSFSFQMLNAAANFTTAAAMMLPAMGLLAGTGIAAPVVGILAFATTAGLNMFEKLALGNSALSDFTTSADNEWFKNNSADNMGQSTLYPIYYTIFVKWLDEGVFGIKTWAFAERDTEERKEFLEKNELSVNDTGMKIKASDVMTLGVSKSLEVANFDKNAPRPIQTMG